MKKNPLKLFIQMSRPILLLGGISQYFLGVGIAKYLGRTIDWNIFWLGLGWIVTMQWVAHLLYDYFETSKNNDPEQFTREVKRIFVGTGLAILAIIFILLVRSGQFNFPVGVVTLLIFFGGFFYVLRPFRLIYSGFGELSVAIIFGSLIPSFAYLLQYQEMNRLVMIISLPLVFLIFSLLLALEFKNYASDIKKNSKNLLVRLGWENGMFLHNTFVLLAFIILGLAGVFGLPSAIILPAFLPLPLAFLQFWHMRQIGAGGKPNWQFLRFNAITLVALMAYVFTYTFWIR